MALANHDEQFTPAQVRYMFKCVGQAEALHDAFTRYQQALRDRQHGGVAANHLVDAVASILERSPYEFEEPQRGTPQLMMANWVIPDQLVRAMQTEGSTLSIRHAGPNNLDWTWSVEYEDGRTGARHQCTGQTMLSVMHGLIDEIHSHPERNLTR